MVSSDSTVAVHSALNPKVFGSSPAAGSREEEMVQKLFLSVAARQFLQLA